MQRSATAWWLPVAAAWVLTGSLPAQTSDERRSLEELLLRARERQAQVQAELRVQLDAVMSEFAPANRTPTPAELASAVERVVRLGSEATPLLVRYLDVPSGATEIEKLRAREVANAMSRMDTTPVTRELLSLLSTTGPDGKRQVLRVLGASPEPVRVRPAIVELFRAADAGLKPACLKALLSLGGEPDEALLAEVLGGSDDALARLALDALTSNRSSGAVDQVRRILHDPERAARHAEGVLRYFQALPNLAASADVQAFVRLGASGKASVDDRVLVLNALPSFKLSLSADLKRQMEPLVSSPDRKLRDSALVLLTRLGDKPARKELLREYDELVAKNERWSESYVRRGDVHARIGEDEDAIKDYKQALAVGRNDPSLNAETWAKLARAYARRGKLKDAADTLRRSPLGDARLKQLAEEADFKPLRDSKYGKDVFGAS